MAMAPMPTGRTNCLKISPVSMAFSAVNWYSVPSTVTPLPRMPTIGTITNQLRNEPQAMTSA